MNPMGPQGPPIPLPEGGGMPEPMMPPAGPAPPLQPVPTAPGAGPGQPMLGDEQVYDTRPTMEEVGYEWADCCSVCVHFMPPEGCERVNGHIRCDGVCPLFTERPGLPKAWGDEYDEYERPMGMEPQGMPPTPTEMEGY